MAEENRQKELELKKQEQARLAEVERKKALDAEAEKKRIETERKQAELKLAQQKYELEMKKLEAQKAVEEAKARQAEAALNQAQIKAKQEQELREKQLAAEEEKRQANAWFDEYERAFKAAQKNVSIVDAQKVVDAIEESVDRLSDENLDKFARMCFVLGTMYKNSRTILRSPEKAQKYFDYAEMIKRKK